MCYLHFISFFLFFRLNKIKKLLYCNIVMNNKTAEHVADVLKALAHPIRLQIIETLESGEKTVSQIMQAVGGKQSITSQQLNMMKDKGILACRKEGANVYYRIENPNAIQLLHCIHNHCEKNGK